MDSHPPKERIMALITRVARLFRADLHALLDQVEEAAPLLRQALREMEHSVQQTANQLDGERRQRELLTRRRDEIDSGLAPIAEQLELCLGSGNDALARLLLRRRLEGERLAAHLERQLAALDATIEAGQRRLDDQRRQLQQLQQQAELHAPAEPAAAASPPRWSAEDFSVSDADVELALLREQRRRA
jgi:phage shock protein A